MLDRTTFGPASACLSGSILTIHCKEMYKIIACWRQVEQQTRPFKIGHSDFQNAEAICHAGMKQGERCVVQLKQGYGYDSQNCGYAPPKGFSSLSQTVFDIHLLRWHAKSKVRFPSFSSAMTITPGWQQILQVSSSSSDMRQTPRHHPASQQMRPQCRGRAACECVRDTLGLA